MSSKASLIFKSSGFRVMQTVISMVIGLLMMPFLIATLGKEQYGLWIVIGSVVGTYYILDLGFNQAVTRYVSRYIHQNNPEGANRIINTALVIYSLLGLLVFIISVVAAFFGADKLLADKSDLDLVMLLLMISGLSLALEFPAKAFPGIISAYMRYDFIAVVRLLKSIIDALLIYLFLSNGYGLIAMAMVTFVTSLISTAIYVKFTTQLFKDINFDKKFVNIKTARDVFNFSKWVFVLDINSLLRNKMDIWFIAFFLSSGVLTVYYVAVRLVEYAISFLTQATGFSTPIFTEYHAKGKARELALSVSLFIKVNFIFGFILLGGFIILGMNFITLWMGSDFPANDAYLCLLIISLGRFSAYFSEPLQSLLMTLNRHNIGAWVSIVESVAIAFMLLMLVPPYGIVGASIAVASPVVIARLIVVPYLVNCLQSINLLTLAGRILLFSVTSAILWWALHNSHRFESLGLVSMVAWAILLGVVQLVIGCILFNREEKQLILGLIKKRLQKNRVQQS